MANAFFFPTSQGNCRARQNTIRRGTTIQSDAKKSFNWTRYDESRQLRFGHYRDKDQQEVDLVVELGGQIWGIEVKAAATTHASDGRGLVRLAGVAGRRFGGGLVLYDGEVVLPVNPQLNIYAAPIRVLWEC